MTDKDIETLFQGWCYAYVQFIRLFVTSLLLDCHSQSSEHLSRQRHLAARFTTVKKFVAKPKSKKVKSSAVVPVSARVIMDIT